MLSHLEIKEGWVSVVLLLIMLLCVAWSIQSADWTYGLAILQPVVLGGAVVGVVLAKSRVPKQMAHLLALLLGFTWAAYLVSRVLATADGLAIEAAVLELDRQIRTWFAVLFAQGTSAGNYMFLLLLAFVLWLVAYVSAWAIFRWQRVWWAVILSGIALMLNISYAPRNLTTYLVAFLVFALLLVVRSSLAFYQEAWQMARIGYSSDVVLSFLRAGMMIIVVAILLAWVAPEALASRPAQEAWDKLGEPWRKLQDQSSRLFHNLNYRNQPAFISFSRSMRFGGPVELSDTPIMDIQAATGRYWRVMAFHEYTGQGWNNSDTDTILIDENAGDISVPDFSLRQEVTQTITLQHKLGPDGTIAAAGQPLRSTLPLSAVVATLTGAEAPRLAVDGTLLSPPPGDPSVLYSRKALGKGDTYQVVSSLSQSDQESLRQAGMDYPTWVVPRYLQLPDSLPLQISVLAEQIATGQETPYDKAVAIEVFLRQIPYNQQIKGPEPGQDGVDYFLFDSRQGYCDYYASAMVVMLRSLGVPARYVRGYSQGSKEEGLYRVLERDGHAWPEVFFPGYGWVEFEPTAGEPLLVRQESQDRAGIEDELGRIRDRRRLEDLREELFDAGTANLPPVPAVELFLRRLRPWVGLVVAVLVASLVAGTLLFSHRRRQVDGLSVAERVYEDLLRWAERLLKVIPRVHQTPNEYGAAVVRLLPRSREPVERIVGSYVGYRFGGPHAVDGRPDGEQLASDWRETYRGLWLGWLRRRGQSARSLLRRLIPSSRQD